MSKIKKGVLLSLMSFGMFLTLTSCGSKSNQFKATTTNESSITTTVANTTTAENTTTFENTTTVANTITAANITTSANTTTTANITTSANTTTTDLTTTSVVQSTTNTTTEIVEQKYLITFKNDDGTIIDSISVKAGEMPQAPSNPTKEADNTYTYTFAGWDKQITAATQNETYTATFNKTYIDYVIKFVDYDNSLIDEKTYHYGNEVVAPANPTRESTTIYTYTFAGWDSDVSEVTGTKTYKATYTQATRKYTISFVDYDGETLSTQEVEYGKMPEVPANPTRDPEGEYTFTFSGWNKEITSVTGNTTYIAQYENIVNKYRITLNNQVVGLTINGITSGNEYDYDSLVTLSASNIPSGYTILWSRSDGVEYTGDTYSFNVPAKNITITLTTKLPYTRDGNKIYFGTYPQTKLDETKDADKIESLNSKVGDLPTTTDKKAWTEYNYYYSSTIMSYMYYQDIDYDNNGTYDYRGVYFTRLRPKYYYNAPSLDNSNQDENGYKINKIYWFSYDPIEWDILSEENGQVLILANLLLDSQEYYPSEETSKFLHNEAEVYANNYAFSNIRKWLNDNFYETAFNTLEKTIIQITMVNNLPSSTSSSSSTYTCANTYDKIFLLSYQEAPKKVYYDDLVGQAQGTDYAKCQGLQVITSGSYAGNSYWYLRSPSYNYANCAYVVSYDGTIYVDYIVYSSSFGVRPACWIKL